MEVLIINSSVGPTRDSPAKITPVLSARTRSSATITSSSSPVSQLSQEIERVPNSENSNLKSSSSVPNTTTASPPSAMAEQVFTHYLRSDTRFQSIFPIRCKSPFLNLIVTVHWSFLYCSYDLIYIRTFLYKTLLLKKLLVCLSDRRGNQRVPGFGRGRRGCREALPRPAR